jgi:hypothetical protein
MRGLLLVLSVVLVMAAMLVVMAAPAFALGQGTGECHHIWHGQVPNKDVHLNCI